MVSTQSRELEAIRSIARTRKTDDLAALCAEMQEIASRTTDSDRVAIYLVDRPNNELVMATTPLGYDGDVAKEYERRPLDGPIMGMVAATRRPAVFSAAMLPDQFRAVALGAGFVEFCIVPLHAEGVLSGTLNLARTYSDPYPEDMTELAMTLGEQISVQIERARAHGELVRKEKLASLGELAMLVAHEVRNPLGVVFNVVSQLRKYIPTETEGAPLLGILEEEANRLDRIVKDFLEFGRPRVPQLRPVSVDSLVSSAVELTNRSLACPSVDWRVAVEPDVGMLDVDEHLVRQALVNVLLNAVEAQSAQGTVWIKAGRRKLREQNHVQILVEDEGATRPNVGAQAFEPFFTTKPVGTGLGLSIVKRTVEAHGGKVQLEARVEGGTVVTIDLPVGERA